MEPWLPATRFDLPVGNLAARSTQTSLTPATNRLGDAERRPHGTKILPFEEVQHKRVAVRWIQLVDDEGLGPVRSLRPQVLLPASFRN